MKHSRMKRMIPIFLTAVLTLGLSACGSASSIQETEESGAVSASEAPDEPEAESTEAAMAPETEMEAETIQAESTDDSAAESSDTESASHILIAYFSMPEDIDTEGLDADAGASVVVTDGEVMGNVEYMAAIIQDTVGGDLFRIETVQQYPLEHEALVDQAAEEQDADARPELSTHIENPDQYDTIILGYPNWWGDMPQALYTFLEEYDFSGKTIIPFCPHGGSGFSRTESTIAELQPDAVVSENGLTISRNDVVGSAQQVADWVASLGL